MPRKGAIMVVEQGKHTKYFPETGQGGIDMLELRNISDTWNMIEKYSIVYYINDEDFIMVSEGDFQRMLDGSANKQYIKNLLACNGNLCTHGYSR